MLSLRWIPRSVIRKFGTPKNLHTILGSPRFKDSEGRLCRRILRQNFAGYWVCQGCPAEPQHPSNCDTVLLYIHGGAYHLGHPLSTLTTLLRIAEIAADNGVSVAIFALNYTLAPEATFPKQQQQALAAYEYLIGEIRIDPFKITVLGESAGGHLALTLLYGIAEKKLARPGGASLLFPWVNLTNSGVSFERNKNYDILNKSMLDTCVDIAFPPHRRSHLPHFLNFAAPMQGDYTWKDILPSFTWIQVGLHDLFVDDIISFKQNAELQGARVVLETAPGMPHAWQLLKDMFDRKEFVALQPGENVGELMKGAKNIAQGLLSIIEQRGNPKGK